MQKGKANIRHSSEQPRWGTNEQVVRIAQTVLGVRIDGPVDRYLAITVDPFSESRFNDGPDGVNAAHFLTGAPGANGFKDRWLAGTDHVLASIGVPAIQTDDSFREAIDACPRADQLLAGFKFNATHVQATALVNPPGDDSGENVKDAYRIVNAYHALGWLGGGVIWVAFNLNQMQTLQIEGLRSPLHGDFVRCVPSRRMPFIPAEITDVREQPSHPCFFMLMPAISSGVAAEQVRLFHDLAEPLGEVW